MITSKKILFIVGLVALAFFAGSTLMSQLDQENLAEKSNNRKDPLYEKFELLSSKGNSQCSVVFKDSIVSMADDIRLQGSCCSPMNWHRYEEQIEGLKKFKDISEIPSDPYDLDAKLAKMLLTHYDDQLTLEQQQEYDYAMTNSHEKGPCCCKCWRWYVYGGLGKLLIRQYGFTGEQVTEVWNLSDGCGGEGDHVNHG